MDAAGLLRVRSCALRREILPVNVKINEQMNGKTNQTGPPKARETGWEDALRSCFPPKSRRAESLTEMFARRNAAREAEQIYHGLRLLAPITSTGENANGDNAANATASVTARTAL
jgi:hypothetical protein